MYLILYIILLICHLTFQNPHLRDQHLFQVCSPALPQLIQYQGFSMLLPNTNQIHLLLSNCLPPTCSGHLGHLSQHTSLCLLGLFPIFLKCEICYSHSPQKTQPKTNLGNKQALLSFSVMSHNLQLKL